MDPLPLTVLNDFLNRPTQLLPYAFLKNNKFDPPKHQHINYIDSIVNDNNFISSYSKAYQIKKQTKKIQAVSFIQTWFKKFKFKVDLNKDNEEKYEQIIEKIIRNQAAMKIQKFFCKNFKNVKKERNYQKVQKMGKVKILKNEKENKDEKNNNRHKIQILMKELQEQNTEMNVEELKDHDFDERILKKVMNYFYYQNNRLKDENAYIKTNL